MRLMQFVISGGLLNNFKILDFFFLKLEKTISGWLIFSHSLLTYIFVTHLKLRKQFKHTLILSCLLFYISCSLFANCTNLTKLLSRSYKSQRGKIIETMINSFFLYMRLLLKLQLILHEIITDIYKLDYYWEQFT